MIVWSTVATVRREGRWWVERSREAERIVGRMPELEGRVPAGRVAYIFGFGEHEFGAMQNDAALKAFGHSATRFILVGLDKGTAAQIRNLRANGGIRDYYCFVYSKGEFADWSERFRDDPEPFLLIRSLDYLENLFRTEYPRSPVRLEPNTDGVTAGRDTLILRLSDFEAPEVDVLYTLDGRLMPAIRNWKLESDRTLRVFVDAGTPRGWYYYRAIRDSRTAGVGGWIPIDTGILVR